MSQNASLTDRLAILAIDVATKSALQAFRPVLERALPKVLAAFYDRLGRVPSVAALFAAGGAERARAAGAQHWLDLFAARFDDAYLEATRAFARTHLASGLEPRWLIAGYAVVLDELTALAVSEYRRRPDQLALSLRAINRAVHLDLDLVDQRDASLAELALGRDHLARELHLDALRNRNGVLADA